MIIGITLRTVCFGNVDAESKLLNHLGGFYSPLLYYGSFVALQHASVVLNTLNSYSHATTLLV